MKLSRRRQLSKLRHYLLRPVQILLSAQGRDRLPSLSLRDPPLFIRHPGPETATLNKTSLSISCCPSSCRVFTGPCYSPRSFFLVCIAEWRPGLGSHVFWHGLRGPVSPLWQPGPSHRPSLLLRGRFRQQRQGTSRRQQAASPSSPQTHILKSRGTRGLPK